MPCDYSKQISLLDFYKKLEAAKLEVIANGKKVALIKRLRSDEWEMIVGEGWLVPDVMVTPHGRVLAFTVVGRRALAQTG